MDVKNDLSYLRVSIETIFDCSLILEDGNVTNQYKMLIGYNEKFNITIMDDDIYITPIVSGTLSIICNIIYFNQNMSKIFSLTVYEYPILKLIKTYKWDNIIMIKAYDQYGIDITNFCEITWSGNYEKINESAIKAGKGKIHVTVTFDNINMEENYNYQVKDKNPIIIFISIGLFLFIIMSLIIFFITKKRKRNNNSSNEEFTAINDNVPINEITIDENNIDEGISMISENEMKPMTEMEIPDLDDVNVSDEPFNETIQNNKQNAETNFIGIQKP